MATRLELDTKLQEILGSDHVYFQPPESIKMIYPAIVYSFLQTSTRHADDSKFLKHKHYRIQVISRDPDNTIVDRLLELPYCSYSSDRIVIDNLYHDNFDLYY